MESGNSYGSDAAALGRSLSGCKDTRVSWQWADLSAGYFAYVNPLRWSKWATIEDAIRDLERQENDFKLRPVHLKFTNAGVPCSLQDNVALAIAYLQEGSVITHTILTQEERQKQSLFECLHLLRSRKPCLRDKNHYLYERAEEVSNALKTDDGDAAKDLLDRLEDDLVTEDETLANAFKLFDTANKKELNREDVKKMNRYLGFPAEDADVNRILELCDADGDEKVSFEEFDNYVTQYGGTQKLFQERIERIEEKVGKKDSESARRSVDQGKLLRCGIERDAQVYWKMVLGAHSNEFVEASALETCQLKAIATIRHLAKYNHQQALPHLQRRVNELGKKESELWMTLAWIRELAPILVHINLGEKQRQWLLNDTHYRNQFETNSSGGLLRHDIRDKWERDLFASAYDKAKPFDRPKYGVQNVMNDYRGVVGCAQYGDSYMVLHDVRLRCTFAPEDSANLKSNKLASLDYYAHVLLEYSNDELIETMEVANSAEKAILGKSEKIGKMKYKEAQIHGEIAYDKHVERLVAHERYKSDPEAKKQIAEICAKHGWQFSWMDEEMDRMKNESMHKLGGAEWEARLEQMNQADDDDIDVPVGFCKQHCGRPVFPGVTRGGGAYTTCCRGCVMGFGHDLLCGQIDASKLGAGLCKMGCGRKVAAGTDPQGRAMTTCCRRCALGLGGHDPMCQNDDVEPERRPGFCIVGCGRKVAPGTTKSGKPFNTCCRACSLGNGHEATCIANDTNEAA